MSFELFSIVSLLQPVFHIVAVTATEKLGWQRIAHKKYFCSVSSKYIQQFKERFLLLVFLIFSVSNFSVALATKTQVREKSKDCQNHKRQPFPDTKRKRKQTKPNKRKSNKRTKSTKISSLSPKRGNYNAKRTEKHKSKITQGKT